MEPFFVRVLIWVDVDQVKHGVMFDRREAEGTKRRHQVDTVVEGMLVVLDRHFLLSLTAHHLEPQRDQ